MENRHTIEELRKWQSLPLSMKEQMTEERIRAWVDTFGIDGVYISFSGGKDSTVLLDIARRAFPNIKAVFVDVPTQYPELRTFAETFDNVDIIRPKIGFMQVCDKYGFPLISKEISQSVSEARIYADIHGSPEKYYKYSRFEGTDVQKNGEKSMYNMSKYKFLLDAPFRISHQCCHVMKKAPIKQYEHEQKRFGITAQMASESLTRTQQWLQFGCNGFDKKRPISNPMGFWTENDILEYIVRHGIEICSVYGDIVEKSDDQVDGQMCLADFGIGEKKREWKCTGCKRTGCMLCGFGCHLDKPGEGRFERLKVSHPKMYNLLDVVKNNGVTFREAIEWTNEHGNLHIRL